MSAEALNCPNCGAGVETNATQCEFCKVRLKTVACPKCFGLMFVGSQFCGHCGAIAAPLEVSLHDETGNCPRCRQPLEVMKIADTGLSGCNRCDGLWMDVTTFEAVCAERERQSAVLGFLDDRTVRGVPMTKVAYVPCPDCGELMNRNNFAKASGVIVDICRDHGVWFDADELPSIIEFIRKGGMEKARERERTELRDERDRLRDQQRKQAAMDARYGTGNILDDRGERDGIRSFVHSLFDV
ncbi:MAG: zf-TFIIB domain-containing protein [Pyrinomonadaceae bacterium]|nr:zf-TFIIB domain-containing protein [Pyrinomonadaceae bacterium]